MKSPFELLATMVAGLGLFFVGINLIRGNLKQLAGRGVRNLIDRMSSSSLGAGLCGVIAGFVTQSGRTNSYIVASFVHSGLIPVRQTLPIVFWANAGCSLMAVPGVFPLTTLILLLVGVCGMLLAFEFPPHARSTYGALFGVALLLFGLSLIKSSAAGFGAYPWFQSLLAIMKDSNLLSFLIGLLLTLVAQSHMGVILIAIAMAGAGVFTADQMFMIILGTHAGSSVITYLLGVNFRGSARQVVMAQVGYNLVGVLLFVGLFYAEEVGSLPLVKAAAAHLFSDIGGQAAFVTVLFNVVTAAMLSTCASPYERFLRRVWPEGEHEALAHTEYLADYAVDQPETATLLAEKEHLRLLQRLPAYLNELRTDPVERAGPSPTAYHAAFSGISGQILEFLGEVLHHDLAVDASERLLNLRGRQDTLATIEEDVFGLVQNLRDTPDTGPVRRLGLSIIESLDTLLLTVIEAAKAGDRQELELVLAMTADRGSIMEGIRRKYLAIDQELTPEERALVLSLTHLYERTTWLVGRYGRLLERTLPPTVA